MASKHKPRPSYPYKRYCSVYGCPSKRKNRDTAFTFFRIPHDIERQQEWLPLIHREELLDEKTAKRAKNIFICDVHFDDSAFIMTKRLKSDAVPTKYLPHKSDHNITMLSNTYTQTLPQTSKDILSQENTSLKSNNDGSSIKSHDARSAVFPVIAKVFTFLKREYEFMKTLNGDNCDLSPLADVLKRTAEATGFSEDDVIMVMEKEGLADHLPDRARRKRKRSCDYGSDDEEVLERDNLDVTVEKETTGHVTISSDDDEMVERENLNITVEKETTGNAGYGHEALSSAPTDVFLASDTEQTQVKVEPEDNGDVTSHNVLHNIPPPESNDEYLNQDEDEKMDIGQYTFTGTIPNVSPNPTASVSEDADIKIEPADDH